MTKMEWKVGSAIYEAWTNRDRACVDWDKIGRAAIEAMREPTEEMIAKVDSMDAINKGVLITPHPYEAWQAMIDAALEEAPCPPSPAV